MRKCQQVCILITPLHIASATPLPNMLSPHASHVPPITTNTPYHISPNYPRNPTSPLISAYLSSPLFNLTCIEVFNSYIPLFPYLWLNPLLLLLLFMLISHLLSHTFFSIPFIRPVISNIFFMFLPPYFISQVLPSIQSWRPLAVNLPCLFPLPSLCRSHQRIPFILLQ